MSVNSSTPSNVSNSTSASSLSASSSPFTISPSPSSPPSSSNSKRLSRPSLAISYSQTPPSMGPPFVVHMTADPKLPTRVSSYYTGHNKRPSASTSTKPSSPMSSISTVVATNSTTSRQELLPTKTVSKQFVAPAHPQSHHLHTLPPREKTTRTLILDHTAWRHGRTRFAQGRCELGMKVRIKGRNDDFQDDDSDNRRPAFYIGSSQSNGIISQASRRRWYSDFGELPEVDVMSSDEEDDMAWDGTESVGVLAYGKRYRERKQRRQGSRTTSTSFMQVDQDQDSASDYDSEDETSSSLYQDARFAPLFAARANGIAKVLCSILRDTQPTLLPSTPPPYSIHVPYANTQHSFQSTIHSETTRVLPNGLRLRLALLELIDDLFERQGSASYERSLSGEENISNENDKAATNNNIPPSSNSNVPPAGLAALVQVSNQPFFAPPTLPSFRTLSLPSSSVTSQNRSLPPPPNSSPFGSSYPPFGGGSGSGSRPPPVFSWTRNSTMSPTPPNLNTLVRDKEAESGGNAPTSPVDKTYRASPIALRGPAPDLPASWTDQVPKTMVASGKLVSPSTALIRRASGRTKDLYAAGCYSTPSSTSNVQTYRTDIPTFSHRGALLTVPPPPPGYPIEKLKTLCPRHLRQKCRICEPAPSVKDTGSAASSFSSFSPATTRIGAGLLKKQRFLRGRGGVEDQSRRSSGSVLADLLPKFLRLSALVAIELGRESRGEEPEARHGGAEEDIRPEAPDSSSANDVKTSFVPHAQPTRAWFALLCGLITRAVLEGYVARGWKGADYIEILMGIGLGIKDVGTRRQSSGIGDFRDDNHNQSQQLAQGPPIVEDAQGEFDPDEMPGLVDACKILFNGLVRDAALPVDSSDKDKSTGTAENEYVQEMEERMSEFLGVSHPCPDLATHLTQMSEKYPAEPVERAALRFCEAIANWRGKPELEMYKKLSTRNSTTSTPALPIHALLASPAPQRPPIQHYFTVPFSARKPTSSSIRGLKRQRSVDEEVRELKKEKVEMRCMDTDPRYKAPSAVNPLANGIVEDLPDADWVGPYGL